MHSSTIASILSFVALAACHGPAGTSAAPVVKGNPNTMFTATFSGSVKGSVMAMAGTGGTGVAFTGDMTLPATGGPFQYHVHEKPVDATGNCASTGAHLDPYMRTDSPPCDTYDPDTCQVGDLSGKFGKIWGGGPIKINVVDNYSSLKVGDPAYIGDKSLVFHSSDGARIACASFKKM